MTSPFAGYHKVLVATDFSPASEAAWQLGIWLARQTRGELTVAHARPNLQHVLRSATLAAKLDLLYGDGETFEREARRDSDARLRQVVADSNVADIAVGYETLLGEPFVEITHAAQQGRYDLVLAGTRGLSAWEQFFVGSTASRLIRKCPTSVGVVKAGHDGPPRTVLAATDFSEVSRGAVREALWIARRAQAELHVIHVIDASDLPETQQGTLALGPTPTASELRQEIRTEAAEHLDAFVESLDADPAAIGQHLSWGVPWKEIGRSAIHLNADLIAIGTVGRSGIKGLLLGNTAEKVLATCDCSLLTTKAPDFISPILPADRASDPGAPNSTTVP